MQMAEGQMWESGQENLPGLAAHPVALVGAALHHSHEIPDQVLSNVHASLILATDIDIERHLLLHLSLHVTATDTLDLDSASRRLLNVLNVLSLRAHHQSSQLKRCQAGVIYNLNVAEVAHGVPVVIVHVLVQDGLDLVDGGSDGLSRRTLQMQVKGFVVTIRHLAFIHETAT